MMMAKDDENQATKLLRKLDQLIGDDLIRWKICTESTVEKDSDKKGAIEGKHDGRRRQQRQEFINYLVSVSTHPIGLRASTSPFNCSQEHMLAYIMDMFAITDTKLKRILVDGGGGQADTVRLKEGAQIIKSRKRHSWRPELRVRLSAPTFFYKQHVFLENLYVRVYLFKDERQREKDGTTTTIITSAKDSNSSSNKLDMAQRSKGVLNRIFQGLMLDPSILIRPVNAMKALVKFEISNIKPNEKLPSFHYKMVQVLNDGTFRKKSNGDLHLNVRRYYCEPDSAHILRFEFWLDTGNTKTGCVNRFRRLVRRFLYNGCYSTCCRRRTMSSANNSPYMNENQEFYGFVNINLTQMPSYAMKQNYPILSLKERKLNNCEISFEPRNRRILEEDYRSRPVRRSKDEEGSKPRKSSEEFLINHTRLYSNCIIYQSLSLSSSPHSYSKDSSEAFQNTNLDSLFYLPAHTLINQHRLQSNLNQFEDRSLRRVSIILLLMKLEQNASTANPDSGLRLRLLKVILASVLRNEYMTANRSIDDKTMQEVDPFRDDPTADESRRIVVEVELASLREFANTFLANRLKQWLLKSDQDQTSTSDSEQSITLLSLKLFKAAISHFKKCNRSQPITSRCQRNVFNLRSSVERLLCKIIVDHLVRRIEKIIDSSAGQNESGGKGNRRKGILRPRAARTGRIEDSNLWLQLLHEVNHINHNLQLYWSRKGLNGIMINEEEFVKRLKMFETLERRKLSSIIETKIVDYLR